MNSRRAFRWSRQALTLLCLVVCFCANKVVSQNQDAKVNTKTGDGLTVVTFVVNPGTIRVNLPDDIRAGDTISGTVIAEPNGNTKEEQGANQSEVKKFRIRLFNSTEDKPEDIALGDVAVIFKYALINNPKSGNVLSVGLMVNSGIISRTTIPVLPMTPSGAIVTPDPKITVPTTQSGAVITPDPKITVPTTKSGAVITPDPKITVPTHPSGAVITPDPKITAPFSFPLMGQTGRPIQVTGPFDGNSSSTRIDWGSPGVTVGEEDREHMGLYSGPLAESPRKAVFQSPTNFTGPTEITLKEGSTETKSQYRNVGVNLSAPKTSLMKGEQTTLTVEVNGLQGLKAPVPLTLTYGGVITMEGGPYQPLVIQPSQVSADGRYTTTRGITGVRTGGWSATATVVTHPFDFCLQDDSVPARVVLWNTFTGDYIFSCPGCFLPKGQGGTAGATGESGAAKTGGATESGGTTTTAGPAGTPGSSPVPPTGLSGAGTMIRKGCIITLTHNAPDRRVFARLDACTNSGSTTIETPPTKAKFTITDRNTADNTCACGPGCK